jgi:hypothetical protein
MFKRFHSTNLKGDDKMALKHIVQIKMPKFLDGMFDKYTDEEKAKIRKLAMVCGSVALGVTVVYLSGYNRGMKKAIDSRGIYIIKSGGD